MESFSLAWHCYVHEERLTGLLNVLLLWVFFHHFDSKLDEWSQGFFVFISLPRACSSSQKLNLIEEIFMKLKVRQEKCRAVVSSYGELWWRPQWFRNLRPPGLFTLLSSVLSKRLWQRSAVRNPQGGGLSLCSCPSEDKAPHRRCSGTALSRNFTKCSNRLKQWLVWVQKPSVAFLALMFEVICSSWTHKNIRNKYGQMYSSVFCHYNVV